MTVSTEAVAARTDVVPEPARAHIAQF